jgi:hypothetical protein
MKTWASGSIAVTFLTPALDGGEWSASLPGRFISSERAPGTHYIGGWVGPRTGGLDTVEKRKIHRPCRELNPDSSAVQPAVRRYTDRTIPVLSCYLYSDL